MSLVDGKPELTRIRVWITRRSYQFRAEIREPGKPAYQVTVGGEAWKQGKGNLYHDRILKHVGFLAKKIADRASALLADHPQV